MADWTPLEWEEAKGRPTSCPQCATLADHVEHVRRIKKAADKKRAEGPFEEGAHGS